MSLFSVLSVSASGMAAQRARAELLVQNLANSETTRTPEGGPYRRQDAVFESAPQTSPFSSVFQTELARAASMASKWPEVIEDPSEGEKRYQPGASRCGSGWLRGVSQREPCRGHGGSAERAAGL